MNRMMSNQNKKANMHFFKTNISSSCSISFVSKFECDLRTFIIQLIASNDEKYCSYVYVKQFQRYFLNSILKKNSQEARSN